MTMNPLPPQAYTKDTLLRAYHWLQNQPGSIKEMALTPDILVSLFLKASREGDHVLERPSIQNFKTELKNLAGLMGELESPQTASPPPAAHPPPATPSSPGPSSAAAFFANPSGHQSPPVTPSSPTPTFQTASFHAPPAAAMIPSEAGALELDPRTRECLRETRELFNLSCESEALRMLIKIGFENARALMPRSGKNS